MNYWNQSDKNIYVAAHRGVSASYPENTMPAFKRAIECGCDQIEIDVRITKDNELVVIHDATVDRTTDGTGKVCDFTLAELKVLDAGCKHASGNFAGQGICIPTLIEFMDLIKDHPAMTLDVELKEYPSQPGKEQIALEVADRVLGILEEYHYAERTVINTFSTELHEYIQKKYGSRYKHHVYYPVEKHADGQTVDPYTYAYCACMFAPDKEKSLCNLATPEECEAMRARGVRTWAGAAVKNEETVDEVIRSGCELITCNNADEILDILRQKGYHK